MTNSLQDIAETFADKARINANFALAAIRGGGPSKEDLPSRIVAYQPANQLIVEGLELLLKAMLLKQGTKPSLEHRLSVLYAELPASDKTVVGTVVHEAIAESSTGALPFELPNEAGVMLLKSITLGVDKPEKDHTSGFADMDACAFFEMLDAEWPTDITQYAGVTRRFSVRKQTLRVNTRVFAGSALACLMLADHILGPEADPTDYVYVLQGNDPGSFVASVTPFTLTEKLQEAHRFETDEHAREAIFALGITGWIARRVARPEAEGR